MFQQQVFSGRYELVRHVARGGMAQVYLAKDILLSRPVALKVLFPELSVDQAFVERFRREAQAAANLTHPNIVSVYDWGQGEHTYFIVMEFVDGNTLSSMIRQGPLDVAHAARIGADVAGALDFAHRHDVIHRDVKPGNVLIDRGGRVKVTDFGIARAIGTKEGLTQTGAVMGTATYFSPEQAQGFSVDARTDVYSLGVVLYEMVVGRPPFEGDNPVSIAYKHVREEPEWPSRANTAIPKSFEAVILHAMAKDASQRYQTAEELRADLLRFSRGDAVMAPSPETLTATSVVPASTDGAAKEPEHSRSALFVGLLLGLLAVLGVLLFFLGRELGLWDSPDVKVLTVPSSVVGEPYSQARSQLSHLGFTHIVRSQQASVTPQGQVLGTQPPPSTQMRSNAPLTLLVSSGPAQIGVPDQTGKTVQAAEADLTAKGLKSQINNMPSTTVPAGIVISQNPVGGTTVLQGQTVTLNVSTGVQMVTVPSVVGDDPVTAASRLTSAGLNPQQMQQNSATVPTGQVIGTNPGAGTSVRAGSTVTVLVSQGPQQVPLPPLTGEPVATAQETLAFEGLTSTVTPQTTADPTQNGIVLATTPPSGYLNVGSSVTLVVGQYVAPPTPTTAPATTTPPAPPASAATTTTPPAPPASAPATTAPPAPPASAPPASTSTPPST
jgi:eukaryotic-like serine/threonine-protein kinase